MMKQKVSLKIIIDMLMAIILIFVMNSKFTGIVIHEWIGLVLPFIIIVHVILNWSWIKAIIRNFNKPNISHKSKMMFILSILLGISIFVIVLSGILISSNILTSISTSNFEGLRSIHVTSSYFLIFLSLMHVSLHWKYLINVFKKMVNTDFKQICATIGGGAIALIGIYAMSINLYTKNNDTSIYTRNTTDSTITRKKEEKSSENSSNNSNTGDISDITLNEYLGKLVCTGCHRRCSLLSPQCSRGVTQAQTATQKYNSSINASN